MGTPSEDDNETDHHSRAAIGSSCNRAGGGPGRQDHPIVDKPLELTIHMHFRDKYVWTDDWPVAKELTRLTGVKLKNVASKATTLSRRRSIC